MKLNSIMIHRARGVMLRVCTHGRMSIALEKWFTNIFTAFGLYPGHYKNVVMNLSVHGDNQFHSGRGMYLLS